MPLSLAIPTRLDKAIVRASPIAATTYVHQAGATRTSAAVDVSIRREKLP